MNRPPRVVASILIGSFFLAASCSPFNRNTPPPSIPFDTSYSAPSDWKLIDDGLWGLRLNVPPTFQDKGFVKKSLWVHEGTSVRLIIDFGNTSSDSLKQQQHYSEVRLPINGLPALVCTYEQSNNVTAGSLKKVIALFFLEKRERLGATREPSYRVEYASDDDRNIALQILQTVRFYDS